MPLVANCETVLPSPLKQVMRCHSVSLAVKPFASLKVLPSLSRLGRLVPRLSEVTRVSPRVVRVSGSVPRLPTRRTVLVMGLTPKGRRDRPDRRSPGHGEASRDDAPQARQGRRGTPETKAGAGREGRSPEQHGPGLERVASDGARHRGEKSMGAVLTSPDGQARRFTFLWKADPPTYRAGRHHSASMPTHSRSGPSRRRGRPFEPNGTTRQSDRPSQTRSTRR